MSKPFYKRWWVIAIAVFLAIGFIGYALESDEAKENRAAENVVAEKEEVTAPELTPEEAIRATIADTIKAEKFKHVVVTDISVNDGIVLPKLQYNATGGHKSAVRVITKYSEALAEALAKDASVTSVTVFWELPKIHDIGNVAKFSYERNGDKLDAGDVWLAAALRE